VERVEATARTLRPLLADPAACTPVLGDFYRLIERTRRPAEIAELTRVCTERLAALGRSGRGRPLRVKLVGESYCALEPFVNFDMVRRLGEMGVLVDPALTPHRWLGFHGFRLGRDEAAGARAASRPYWRYCAGGEDEASLGHMIIAARAGFDGVVHVHPFACMPGTVVQPTMARVSRDYDMPFLSLSIDEHSSETGVLTRLEAFVSMLERRQRSRRTV
jgi:predicted nucleotide-binding protein (sugar kinase/HSP70/actin superfamily)